MRPHRYALVAAWMVVSLVAVVGFANFTSRRQAPTTTETTVAVAADLGRDAGAVAAMAFTVLDDGVIRSQPAEDETTTTEPAPSTSDRRATTTVIRSSILGESEVRAHAEGYFLPEDLPRALRAAWCASGFNPEAVNTSTGTAGLFQIPLDEWAGHAASAGFPGADILDPRANTAVAAWVVYNIEGGWSNLVCSG